MIAQFKNCGLGVNRDLLSSELADGAWSDCTNARFRNGFAEKRKGTAAAYNTPTITPYFISGFGSGTSRFVVYAGTLKVFCDDGTTKTDLTGATVFSGGVDDRWSGGAFNGTMILNNGVDTPVYWNGLVASSVAALTGWTAGWKSDVIRPFKSYLVALGNTRGGSKQVHQCGWSASAAPGAIPSSWTASASNDAGAVDLPTNGVMVDCAPWADLNIIYKQDGRFTQQYIGGNDVFAFQKLPGDDGLLARGCVANTPKGQVFLSNGDVKLWAGGETISIAEGSVRKWLFANMDSTYASRSFLTVNPQKAEVWICFPTVGSSVCNRVLVWNWNDQTWGDFSIANMTYAAPVIIPAGLVSNTIDSTTSIIDTDVAILNENEYSPNEARVVLTTSDPRIGIADIGSTDFGTSVPFMLERTGINFGDTDSIKVLSASRPQFKGASGTSVSVYHGSHMAASSGATYASPAAYSVGVSNWANAFSNGGRYLALKITSSDYAPVALRSVDLDITKQGRF